MSGLSSPPSSERDEAAWLRSAPAIRVQCAKLFALAEKDELESWRLDLTKLPAASEYVLEVIRAEYPTLVIPYHARWRHFDVGSVDRTAALTRALRDEGLDAAGVARAKIELAIVSVLLDAGAGMGWRWKDPKDGRVYAKSEGLALASLQLFDGGGPFASDNGWQVTPHALAAVDATALGRAFQVTPTNPLAGFDGRLALLAKLGDAVAKAPHFLSKTGGERRLGNLFDALEAASEKTPSGRRRVRAPQILAALLEALGSIWPSRLSVAGVDLGDAWRHPQLTARDQGLGIVPFHKLSQWLAYSLVEPLIEAGLDVEDLDGLTGLPEYRNGGLLIDLGVIVPRDAKLLSTPLAPDHAAIVSWRALTVVLLDRMATLVRRSLGKSQADFPLACLLQGGTWTAGRKIAAARRGDGGPPLQIVSDGTVF
jgi:hypothetical protein